MHPFVEGRPDRSRILLTEDLVEPVSGTDPAAAANCDARSCTFRKAIIHNRNKQLHTEETGGSRSTYPHTQHIFMRCASALEEESSGISPWTSKKKIFVFAVLNPTYPRRKQEQKDRKVGTNQGKEEKEEELSGCRRYLGHSKNPSNLSPPATHCWTYCLGSELVTLSPLMISILIMVSGVVKQFILMSPYLVPFVTWLHG